MFVSEEDKIVRRIINFIRNKEAFGSLIYIMLRNGHILNIDGYRNTVSAGRINPQDAYVYIGIDSLPSETVFYYPFLGWYNEILFAYFSKLGFYSRDSIVPATGLRYIASVVRYGDYLTVELLNLDTAVNNTNLRTIVFEVLGEKLVSREKELTYEEYIKIVNTFRSQRLFAGYNVDKARRIIKDYYDKGNKSLAKEVARIAMDYDRIFHPYRVCYDMDNWKEVDCWSIK